MNIRFAKNMDISRLKLIWNVCFGDSYEYIDFFFKYMFRPENAVVADINGEVAGVVHLLDAKYCKTHFKYGYAIGVLPEFRGNSLCYKMHEFIKKYCENNSYMYGLHPANDKLANFYKGIGLNEMYSLKFIENVDSDIDEVFNISDLTPEDYFNIRQSHFPNMVSWSKETISYMVSEARHFGGFAKKIIIGGYDRILLVKKSEKEIVVKETTMSDEEIMKTNNFLKKYFCGEKVKYVLPNTSKLSNKAKNTIFGFNEKNDDVYMNLYFD